MQITTQASGSCVGLATWTCWYWHAYCGMYVTGWYFKSAIYFKLLPFIMWNSH